MLLEETNNILLSINALCKNEDSTLKNIFSKYLQLTVSESLSIYLFIF